MEGLRRLHEVAEAAEPVLPEVEPERVTELAWVTGFMLQQWPALMERMQRELERRGNLP
ncbi:MAG TPA: hypothetical protein VK923_15985 [Euzebyales bacterium]|nr:hypothetical protein [Euzebyales bacterium]